MTSHDVSLVYSGTLWTTLHSHLQSHLQTHNDKARQSIYYFISLPSQLCKSESLLVYQLRTPSQGYDIISKQT